MRLYVRSPGRSRVGACTPAEAPERLAARAGRASSHSPGWHLAVTDGVRPAARAPIWTSAHDDVQPPDHAPAGGELDPERAGGQADRRPDPGRNRGAVALLAAADQPSVRGVPRGDDRAARRLRLEPEDRPGLRHARSEPRLWRARP